MNLIDTFQQLVSQVPDLIQPLIVAAAGAIPFIEGEGAAGIGIIAGIPALVAVVAAVVGNFLCVTVLVLLSSGARRAVVGRRRGRLRANGVEPDGYRGPVTGTVDAVDVIGGRASTRTEKFQRAFDRFGVPGVSLLGPLLLPTQFTATMLAAIGIRRVRILVWQAVAIIAWTTVVGVLINGAVILVK